MPLHRNAHKRVASVQVAGEPALIIVRQDGRESLHLGNRVLIHPLPTEAKILAFELKDENLLVHIGIEGHTVEVQLQTTDSLLSLEIDLSRRQVHAKFSRDAEVDQVEHPVPETPLYH